jgi:hypothetical protein
VTTGDYWVDIRQGKRRLGAGFMLTTCYVLTALHCLDDLDVGNDAVDILIGGTKNISGRVYRRSYEADLALIDIPDRGAIQLAIPNVDRAVQGEKWRNPYRPSIRYAEMSGNIDAFPIEYQCEGGGEIEAIQLKCEQSVGDYSGYSGSPVERNDPDKSQFVLGLLIEQYEDQDPSRQTSQRATNVLFAVAIAEVYRRFDNFHTGNLARALPSADEISTSAKRDEITVAPREPSISIAEAKLLAIRKWEEDGLLDGVDIAALAAMKLRVVQSLVERGPGEDA